MYRNSLGLRIPRWLTEGAKVSEGAAVDPRVEEGRLIAEPVDVLSSDALISWITPENRRGEVFDAQPVGRETL